MHVFECLIAAHIIIIFLHISVFFSILALKQKIVALATAKSRVRFPELVKMSHLWITYGRKCIIVNDSKCFTAEWKTQTEKHQVKLVSDHGLIKNGLNDGMKREVKDRCCQITHVCTGDKNPLYILFHPKIPPMKTINITLCRW